MKSSDILFSCHSLNDLMVGGNEISGNQLEKLDYLEKKEKGEVLHKTTGKPLKMTEKDKGDLKDLREKRDAPFEFGDTAKTLIEDLWLWNEYGYKKIVETNQTMKGKKSEQDSMDLAREVIGGEMRISWATIGDQLRNDWIKGTPDCLLKKEEVVEDMKSNYDIRSFMRVKELDPRYYGQVQGYMWLSGFEKARVVFCLVNTPEEIVMKEIKKLFFMYGGEDDDPNYLRAVDQIKQNHNYDLIPSEDRVKWFDVERDDEYLKKLKERIEFAREYYGSLKLTMINVK
jgi:hypothetical protein